MYIYYFLITLTYGEIYIDIIEIMRKQVIKIITLRSCHIEI